MEIINTEFEGVVILKPEVFKDDRGYFFETFKEFFFEKNVFNTKFVKDIEIYTKYGVIIGLHYQLYPYTLRKLIRVVLGKALYVIVDIRKNSSSYGKHITVELSSENKNQIFIPEGFAQGFISLYENTNIQIKCDKIINNDNDYGIAWNDPDLNINWPVDRKDIKISEKDSTNPLFRNIKLN